jgi:hypothetical protein
MSNLTNLTNLTADDIMSHALYLALGPNPEKPCAYILACTIYPEDKALFRPAVQLGKCVYVSASETGICSRLTVDPEVFIDIVYDHPESKTASVLVYQVSKAKAQTTRLARRQGIS